MHKKFIFLMGFLIVMVWSVWGLCMNRQPAPSQSGIASSQSATFPIAATGPAAINPCDPDAPQGWPRKYTGIIRNGTGVDVALYSGNSDATLIIPAHSWIEYDAWLRHFDLTAYSEGKPYCCLKICANPEAYPFMCRKYDFMVEICGAYGMPLKHGKAGSSKKLKRRVRHEKALS
jgi:hypothetical protein